MLQCIRPIYLYWGGANIGRSGCMVLEPYNPKRLEKEETTRLAYGDFTALLHSVSALLCNPLHETNKHGDGLILFPSYRRLPYKQF